MSQLRNYFGGSAGYYGSSNKMNGRRVVCSEWASQEPVAMMVIKSTTQVVQPPAPTSGFSYVDGTSRLFGPSRGFYKARYFGPISPY